MNERQHPLDPILVIDDEESILLSVDTILRMAGWNNIVTCSESREAMVLVEQRTPSVVLLDLNMPYLSGEAIIEKLAASHPRVPIIVITGRIDAETAVDCMKSGAFDYIVKPVEEERLLVAVRKALRTSQVGPDHSGEKQARLKHPEQFRAIVTNSAKMYAVFEYIESIATTNQPVLVKGETGTGKELVARAVHDLSRTAGPFVAVNVAGLDDNVFSDTLFGHVRGAFTGADKERAGLIERATGGTLFLDEIGDLNPASQVKLLRLLQENEYMPLGQDAVRRSSARIIASTHVDLWRMQAEGSFREDLHYRLRTHRIQVPPLRERKEDLPALIDHFLGLSTQALNKPRPRVPGELITLLETYHFPGNVRELQAMVFDAMAQHKNGTLALTAFREHMVLMRKIEEKQLESGSTSATSFAGAKTLPSIKHATRMLIEEAMHRANNNQSIAASLLGISQQALSKRLKNLSQEK